MRVVLPEILPNLAEMVVEPAAIAVAKPLLLIVTTEIMDEFQVTCEVKSWVVPSENVPVAANCWVDPNIILMLEGVRDMEDRVPDVTVRVVLPEILPKLAEMVVVPVATAVVRPLLLTVASEVLDELQVTAVVKSKVVLSENVPVAVSCWVDPTDMLGLPGVTEMEVRVAEVTVRVVFAEMLPD